MLPPQLGNEVEHLRRAVDQHHVVPNQTITRTVVKESRRQERRGRSNLFLFPVSRFLITAAN